MPILPHIGDIVARSFLDPKRGSNLQEEIQCYGLPYGALGFISHILTFWTITWLTRGRNSLGMKVNFALWGLMLAIVGLVSGFVLTTFTLMRCRNSWQLLLIGMWKMSMSIFNGVVGIHVSVVVSGKDSDSDFETLLAWLWVVLYLPFEVIGFTGLMSLASQHWTSQTRIITLIFVGLIGIAVVSALVFPLTGVIGQGEGIFVGLLVIFGLVSLYADWMLGAMVNNLLGVPSGDNALIYWLYFGSKRLNMLNF